MIDADELVYLKSNSGIGGALVSGGRVIEGAHGVGGALGHLAVVPDGVRCECGQVGCLVTVAGPDVLLERAGLSAAVAADGLGAALEELSRRIVDGEPLAAAGWNDALPWIARTLQILSLATDPGSSSSADSGRRTPRRSSGRSVRTDRRSPGSMGRHPAHPWSSPDASAPTPRCSGRCGRRATGSSPTRCGSPSDPLRPGRSTEG